jgi:hypothetical protein
MNFHRVRPWLHLKVAAKAEPIFSRRPRSKSRPFADKRILSIRADEPTVRKAFLGRRHNLSIDSRHSRPPAEFHTYINRVGDKQLMQLCAAHRKSRCARKIRAHGMFPIHKSDSTEWEDAFRRKGNAESS